MRPSHMAFSDLLSLHEAAGILCGLHQRQLVFNIRPSVQAVALALLHLSTRQQVALTRRALGNVRNVAITSLSRHRSSGISRRAWVLRMWASLSIRALRSLERSSVLFPHLLFAAVVLLQDFMLSHGTDPFALTKVGRHDWWKGGGSSAGPDAPPCPPGWLAGRTRRRRR